MCHGVCSDDWKVDTRNLFQHVLYTHEVLKLMRSLRSCLTHITTQVRVLSSHTPQQYMYSTSGVFPAHHTLNFPALGYGLKYVVQHTARLGFGRSVVHVLLELFSVTEHAVCSVDSMCWCLYESMSVCLWFNLYYIMLMLCCRSLELFPKVLSTLEMKDSLDVNGNQMKGSEFKSHVLNSLCSCRSALLYAVRSQFYCAFRNYLGTNVYPYLGTLDDNADAEHISTSSPSVFWKTQLE